jgi:hypothetical protein
MNILLSGVFHPSFDALEEFVARHASPAARRRVANHVSSCQRCQTTVRELRELRRRETEAPSPSIDKNLLGRIQTAAASGIHVILPTSTITRPARRSWHAYGAIAVAACLLLLFLVPVRQSQLEAALTVGELTLSQRATAPVSVHAHYRAATSFESADSVLLRAVTYDARSFTPNPEVSYILRRQSNGTFAADFSLPRDAVLARFAIASPDGKHVDDNSARAWEFIPLDSMARPLLHGLLVQNVIHSFDDWERAFAASQAMFRYYPEQPEALRTVIAETIQLRGAAAADSIVQAFRPRVDALQNKLMARPADATLIWQMAMLSAQVGDTAMARRWTERSTREYPRDAGTVQLRDFAIFAAPMSPSQRLRALDALFDEHGGAAPQLAYDAFTLAKDLGDSTTLMRWGARLMQHPRSDIVVANAYIRVPSLRAVGEQLLRASLAKSPAVPLLDWRVAVRTPTADMQVRGDQYTLIALGRALLDDHQNLAALDTLRRAAAIAWDLSAIELLGRAELATGNGSRAAEAYAWVLADSRTTESRADSLRGLVANAVSARAFDSLSAAGRAVLRELTAQTTFHRSFVGGARFSEAGGARRTIKGTTGEGLAVVAFISRHCAPALADLPSLQRLSDQMATLGIPVIVLLEEKPTNDATEALARRGYHGPVFFDDRAEVARGMRQVGTPSYFVVEGGASIRAQSIRAEDLIPVVDALRGR